MFVKGARFCSLNVAPFRSDRPVIFFENVDVPEYLKKYVDLENTLSDFTEDKMELVVKSIPTDFTDKEMNYVFRMIIYFSRIRSTKVNLFAQLYGELMIKHGEYAPSLSSICSLSSTFSKKLYEFGIVDPIAEAEKLGQNNEYCSKLGTGVSCSNDNNEIRRVFRGLFNDNNEIRNIASVEQDQTIIEGNTSIDSVLNRKLQKRLLIKEIIEAVKEDKIEVLQEKAASPNFKWKYLSKIKRNRHTIDNVNDNSPAQIAAEYGAIKCFKYMLINNVELICISNSAIKGGNEEIIRLCEQKGLKFNRQMCTALESYHLTIADYLIKKQYNIDDFSFRDCCCSIPTTIPFLYLLQNGCISNNDELSTSISRNRDNFVLAILNDKKLSFNGQRLVPLAAQKDNFDMVEKLIEHGFPLEETNDGLTALGHAANSHNYKLVKFLLDKGANPDNNDYYNYIRTGDVEILKLLKEHGFTFKDPTSIRRGDNPLLFTAISTGKLEIVKLIYESCPNLDIKSTRETPLAAFAALSKKPEILYFLIEKGVKLNELSTYWRCRDLGEIRDLEIVKLIFENGGDLDESAVNQIYLNFISSNNKEGVMYLFSKGKKLPNNSLRTATGNIGIDNELLNFLFENSRDCDLAEIIGVSIKRGNFAQVKRIIEKGFNINQAIDFERRFRTPLGIAVRANQVEMIKYLLEKGAKAEGTKEMPKISEEQRPRHREIIECGIGRRCIRDNSPATQLENPPIVRATRKSFEVFKLLADKCTNIKEFMPLFTKKLATKHINKQIVDYLFDNVLDPNSAYNDKTLLYHAVKRGYIDLVKNIVERGVDINKSLSTTERPKCALKTAVRRNDEIIKYLLEKGANPNGIPYEGKITPLGKAIRSNSQVVSLLLEKGADPNIHYGVNKTTAFIEAASCADQTILEQLLNKGADINAENSQGRTALFFANNISTLTFLLDRGMDPNHTDKDGKTALHKFAQFGDTGPRNIRSSNIDIVKLLISKGADPNKRDLPVTPLSKLGESTRNTILDYYKKRSSAK